MPDNQQSLSFTYNPPTYVKVIGRAANRDWQPHTYISGVLVKEGTTYQLLDPQ